MLRAPATLVASLLMGWSFASCSGHGRPVPSEPAPQEGLPFGRVVLLSPGGPDVTVRAQIARSDPEREKGLMFRRSLPAGEGMLFLFEEQQPLSFWMKNTYIPLDMIFIDRDLTVVGVVANAEPRSLEPRSPAAPAQYVLEVNAGFASLHGIVVGTKVRFELPR